MITLYLISGIPGSGKTTLAHKTAELNNATVHSYDNMPNANTKESMDGSVKQAWIKAIREDLQTGKSVVGDGLNLTVESRKELLTCVSDIPCKKVLLFKIVPLEICLKRNAQRQVRLPDFVIEQSAQRLEAPAKDEGWDEIYVYKD